MSKSLNRLFFAAAALIPAGITYAQTAATPAGAQAADEAVLEEIVITGSRLSAPGFATPTPCRC